MMFAACASPGRPDADRVMSLLTEKIEQKVGSMAATKITRELRRVLKPAADKDGFLNDSNGQPWLDWEGKPLHKDRINLYDVTKYIIKPATAEQKCSYVELVAPPGTDAQTPRWFVSHWWGEPVKDFIMAVEYHAVQRFAPRGEFDINWIGGEPNEDRNNFYKPQHKIVGKPADADATHWNGSMPHALKTQLNIFYHEITLVDSPLFYL